MATYNFKSSGRSVQAQIAEQVQQTQVPIGIKTPLRLGQNGEGIFATHDDLAEQVQDNLRNLLLTNWGERLGLYDFGANLRELTTEATAQDAFDEEAITRIRAAISKYMPYVEPQTFESVFDHEKNKSTGIVRVKISYNVPLLNITDKAIEVVLWFI